MIISIIFDIKSILKEEEEARLNKYFNSLNFFFYNISKRLTLLLKQNKKAFY
jgi:hypothetical protein